MFTPKGENISVRRSAPDFDFTDSRRISGLMWARREPDRVISAEVGPRYHDYRHAWNRARGFEQRPAFPLQVDYEPLYRCNLACPICIMSLPAEEKFRWGDPAQTLSFETIRRLLDEGAAGGQAAVGLNGICEPLLTPELPEIVAYARRLGLLDVMFNTNGLLLDEKVSAALIRAGLTRLMISLDAATRDTYDRIRVGSDFDAVCSNIRRFIRLRDEMGSALPLVRVSFCVTSLNEHELVDFIRTWSDQVDFLSIQHYGNTFEGRYARERSVLFPQGRRYDPGDRPRCAQPWKRVMVRHNGDVIPCCDASGLGLVVGNVHEQTLAEIWQGEKAIEVAQLHFEGRYQDHPVCRACMSKWGDPPVKERA